MEQNYPLNPYYSHDKLQLSVLVFDQPNMCYEYNTLCFFSTPKGEVYAAKDSGCSCPTPFEEYEGRTTDEVVRKMERVGSVHQAESIFRDWNNGIYDTRDKLLESDAVSEIRNFLRGTDAI